MLARKNDQGEWVQWNGRNEAVPRVGEMHTTATVRFLDGRTVDIRAGEPFVFDPYPIADTLTAASIEPGWSDADLAVYGIARVVPFHIPDGQQVTGPGWLEERKGRVFEMYPTEDIPPPPPVEEVTPEQKLERMAAAFGMSVDELDAVLATRRAAAPVEGLVAEGQISGDAQS